MAYVVARRNGRFEIRESVHTPKGPRARSLANFARFTDEVLERARARASRPFDADEVRAAALRATGPADVERPPTAADSAATVPRHAQPETRSFVEASRRMVRSFERTPAMADREDPGDALLGLLDFVALSASSRPPRPPERLQFPPLARVRAARGSGDVQPF